MIDMYQIENNELLQNMMEKTFLESWKLQWKMYVENDSDASKKWKDNEVFYGNYASLEFQLNQHCDLDCLYCYEQKYGDTYFPGNTSDKKVVLHNIDLLLEYLYENKMFPRIEIFSGDPLVQTIGHDVVNKIITAAENGKKITNFISIPTNMSFLLHPDKLESIQDLMDRGKKIGVQVGLSASVDGAFMEDNRPFKRDDKFVRDEQYYDTLFKFAKRNRMGFHPMIYSNNISNWINNFLWFQDMFKKYDMPWMSLYLLEIRNIEWSEDECVELYNFMRFLVHWTFNKIGRNAEIYKSGGDFFNILASGFSSGGRGIGCSLQSTIQLRVGDLSWAMCHRLMYDKLNAGKFVVENDKITGKFEASNLESHIGLQGADVLSFPHCETCMLKYLCNAGCLGSNYESTGDPYSTHPSVCRVEHYKILGILQGIADNNLFPVVMSSISKMKQESVKNFVDSGLVKFNEEYDYTKYITEYENLKVKK